MSTATQTLIRVTVSLATDRPLLPCTDRLEREHCDFTHYA
jgi:hypothetical protein